MGSEAAQYAGRLGFELNGQFVEDGIIRSFHALPPNPRRVVVLEGEWDGDIEAYPLEGVALCEFPDEDNGAVHAAFVLVVVTTWGVSLYDGAAPGGNSFLGVSHAWPEDRQRWLDMEQRKGTQHGHNEVRHEDAHAPGWHPDRIG